MKWFAKRRAERAHEALMVERDRLLGESSEKVRQNNVWTAWSLMYKLNKQGVRWTHMKFAPHPFNNDINVEISDRVILGADRGRSSDCIAACFEMSDPLKEIEHLKKCRSTLESLVGYLGNVDHSTGNGPRAAEMRGHMLNNIRSIVQEALKR